MKLRWSTPAPWPTQPTSGLGLKQCGYLFAPHPCNPEEGVLGVLPELKGPGECLLPGGPELECTARMAWAGQTQQPAAKQLLQ